MKGQKLADGKVVGGRNRLTDLTMDRMQNHFGEAIRKNSGNVKQMKNVLAAVFHHMVKNDNNTIETQHQYCPKNDWCKFWNNRDQYNNDKRLPHVFFEHFRICYRG